MNISSRSPSSLFSVCAEKKNMVIIHSPGCINGKQTERSAQNTIPANRQQAATVDGRGRRGGGSILNVPASSYLFVNLGAELMNGGVVFVWQLSSNINNLLLHL